MPSSHPQHRIVLCVRDGQYVAHVEPGEGPLIDLPDGYQESHPLCIRITNLNAFRARSAQLRQLLELERDEGRGTWRRFTTAMGIAFLQGRFQAIPDAPSQPRTWKYVLYHHHRGTALADLRVRLTKSSEMFDGDVIAEEPLLLPPGGDGAQLYETVGRALENQWVGKPGFFPACQLLTAAFLTGRLVRMTKEGIRSLPPVPAITVPA
jgi:hypothetical protein